MSQKLLLVLPLQAYRYESQVFVDAQARNGLRLWLENFDTLVLACPTIDGPPPTSYALVDDNRITFTALPAVYTPHRFAAALHKTIPILRDIIASSDHLHFAIGGLFGDWASVAALVASRNDRQFAVWTDRVESKVQAFQANSKSGLKKPYYLMTAVLMTLYERHVIKKSALGLFHGMDCYQVYSPYSSNPRLVHDIHLSREDQISDQDIEARLQRELGPTMIAYAGRAHRDKGIYDWIDALSLASRDGVDFKAVWFGDGPELEAARARVTKDHLSHCIEFSGSTASHSDLIKKLRTFDIFVFCHKTQESPRNLIEALICGLPLIGYSSPYARDLIRVNFGGILTETDRPELITRSIRYFLEQRRPMTKKAQLDGKLFDAPSVFRHRSDLMKSIVNPTLKC